MARKTIADLEKLVEYYKGLLGETNAKNVELVKQADEGFEASALYKSMKADLELKTKEIERAEKSKEDTEIKYNRLGEDVRQVFLDNRAFMENNDGKYWIGISQSDEQRNYDKLKKEYAATEAKLKSANETIEFLREYIRAELYKGDDTEAVEMAQPQKTGRKSKIDADLVKRVKGYKRKKYTVRKIAEIEGVSIGLVQKIIKM